MAWAVSFEPVPAMTGTSTAWRTARNRSTDSVADSVGDSPVVPLTTSPSLPWSTSHRASDLGAVEIEAAVVVERA